MLDVPGTRKVLRDLGVSASGDPAVLADHQARRSRGAFVDGQNVLHSVIPTRFM
jgi:hypothetical protein